MNGAVNETYLCELIKINNKYAEIRVKQDM